MHTIQTMQPRPELKRFVRCFAHREADQSFDLELIASLETILSFDFADRAMMEYADGRRRLNPAFHVLCPQPHMTRCAHFSGRVIGFGIFLTSTALWQLFRIPPSILVGSDLAGEDLLGRAGVRLWARLAEGKSFAERVSIAEQFLLPFALGHKSSYIVDSAAHLVRHQGSIRINEVANSCSLSLRQYERRFAHELGMSPKRFARITRFQAALDARRRAANRSWLSIAHELGYFDQMHMIEDFHTLGRGAPGLVMQRSVDLQPWSLASMEPVDVRTE